jgi:hypothetical protein
MAPDKKLQKKVLAAAAAALAKADGPVKPAKVCAPHMHLLLFDVIVTVMSA